MEKSYKIENLGCANCAAKMERKIRKINGVKDASINYMAQKLLLETSTDDYIGILSEVQSIIGKIEHEAKLIY